MLHLVSTPPVLLWSLETQEATSNVSNCHLISENLTKVSRQHFSIKTQRFIINAILISWKIIFYLQKAGEMEIKKLEKVLSQVREPQKQEEYINDD